MEHDPYYYKQALLIRRDLNMTRGKEISQGAHASMITLIHNGEDPRMKEWLAGPFTKVALSVPDEAEMMRIYEEAKARGVICALVEDHGRTMFDGVLTRTVVAIGPDKREVIDELCGHLKLR